MREGLLPCKYPRSQRTQGLLSQLEMLPSVWKVWIIQSCDTVRAQVIRNPPKPEVLTPLTDWSTFFWSLHKLSITKFLIKIPLFSKSLLNDRTAFFSFLFFFPFFYPSFDLLCVVHLGLTVEAAGAAFPASQHFGLNYFGLKYAEVISIELQKSWVIPCTFICLISYRIILWVSRGSSLAGTTFSLVIFARITGREREIEMQMSRCPILRAKVKITLMDFSIVLTLQLRVDFKDFAIRTPAELLKTKVSGLSVM